MRWVLVVLCLVGVIAASLALREHYREDASPCSAPAAGWARVVVIGCWSPGIV